MRNRIAAIPLILLLLLLATAWIAYSPGAHGNFLFDDFANLTALGVTGPIETWPSFWRYITSGTADPTGRPLTLLTFLLDAHNWPADPFPFKRTNLILHLLNGALLALLLRQLGRTVFSTSDQRRADLAAAVGAGTTVSAAPPADGVSTAVATTTWRSVGPAACAAGTSPSAAASLAAVTRAVGSSPGIAEAAMTTLGSSAWAASSEGESV